MTKLQNRFVRTFPKPVENIGVSGHGNKTRVLDKTRQNNVSAGDVWHSAFVAGRYVLYLRRIQNKWEITL